MNPPSAGPTIAVIWNRLAVHVNALGSTLIGTMLGTSAARALCADLVEQNSHIDIFFY